MKYAEMKDVVRKWREDCLPDCNGPNDSYCLVGAKDHPCAGSPRRQGRRGGG